MTEESRLTPALLFSDRTTTGLVQRLAPAAPLPSTPLFRGVGPPFGEPIGCAAFTTTATTLYEATELDLLAFVELETATP